MESSNDKPKTGQRRKSVTQSKKTKKTIVANDDLAATISQNIGSTIEPKENEPGEEKLKNKEKSTIKFIEDPFKPGKKIENPNHVYMILDENTYSTEGDEDGKPRKLSVEKRVIFTVDEYNKFTKKNKDNRSVFDNLGFRVQKVLYHPNNQ
jgi:hypothetical protein